MTKPPHRLSPSVLLLLLTTAASVTACGSASDEGESVVGGEMGTGGAPGEQLQNANVNGGASSPPGTPAGAAHGAGAPGSPAAPGAAPPPGDAPVQEGAPGAVSLERQVTAKLGLGGNFLIGLGNDAVTVDPNQTHTYGLSQKLDLHYMYLSGLDWPAWTASPGDYVTQHAAAAKARGIVPMFTLYQAASYGENNLGAFNTVDFMTRYWRGVRLMLEKLGATDAPAVVHVEPDLWGYTQRKSELPSAVPMKVGALVPECTDLPADVSGMAKCVIRLSRQLAPKVVIGLSASAFGAYTNGQSDPARIATYMNQLGADQGDIIVIETLDRDAGCFEVGADQNCKRAGSFWWDEANVAHPNFHDHLAWAKKIREVVGRPLLWWQMPLGAPSLNAGHAAHYRDNRVRYLFSHPAEFAAAGGIGAVFGTGAPNQTTAATDGGQFLNAVSGYYAAPAALP